MVSSLDNIYSESTHIPPHSYIHKLIHTHSFSYTLTHHPLPYNLVLLPLLCPPLPTHLDLQHANPLGQPRQQQILRDIRDDEIAQAQHQQENLERHVHVRQLHGVHDPIRGVEEHVGAESQSEEDGADEGQIATHGLAVGTADAEDDSGERVLEAGDEEEGGVLRIEAIGVVWVEDGGLVPGLALDEVECEVLGEDAEDHLAEQGGEDFAADKVGGGAFAR